MSAPIPGDPVYLGSFLANTHWYGVVGDGDTPAMQVATMEAVGQDAVLALDALRGEKGDKGDPADIVALQYDSALTMSSQLPTADAANGFTRPLTLADVGMAWWIDSMVYVWTGTHYVAKQMGSPGQPGPTPSITVTMERIAPGLTSTVERTGTTLNPQLHFRISAPAGPQGPASSIVLANDYDNTLPPEDGQVVTWNSTKNKWEPSDFAAKHPRLYSVPEAAFTSFTGPAQRQTILSYVLEAQDYAYVPKVSGHLKAIGVVLGADPLTIGCEVRLGDPISGQLIGRGFGNISNWATITPHFSEPGDPTRAVAPDNGVAMVAAGQTATINVNLYNDGLLGAYIFNKSGAHLDIETIPQG
ncbi:phage tail protein [Mycobacteroides chelonae]|nr:phage tail protein [Mycobacteroides chelonae]MEC4873152.1 phage tail protein [Mycobacteroides chelonae]